MKDKLDEILKEIKDVNYRLGFLQLDRLVNKSENKTDIQPISCFCNGRCTREKYVDKHEAQQTS